MIEPIQWFYVSCIGIITFTVFFMSIWSSIKEKVRTQTLVPFHNSRFIEWLTFIGVLGIGVMQITTSIKTIELTDVAVKVAKQEQSDNQNQHNFDKMKTVLEMYHDYYKSDTDAISIKLTKLKYIANSLGLDSQAINTLNTIIQKIDPKKNDSDTQPSFSFNPYLDKVILFHIVEQNENSVKSLNDSLPLEFKNIIEFFSDGYALDTKNNEIIKIIYYKEINLDIAMELKKRIEDRILSNNQQVISIQKNDVKETRYGTDRQIEVVFRKDFVFTPKN